MSVKSFLKGLVTGAAVGAAAGVSLGLLNAPKTGKQLRKDLQAYGEEMKGEVEKMLAKAREASTDAYKQAVEEVSALYEKAKKFNKEDLETLKSWLMTQWKSVQKRIEDMKKEE